MTCTNCGIELADNAKFCPECGEKVVRECVCQNCGTKLALNAKFCPECGTKVFENDAIMQQNVSVKKDVLAEETGNLLTEKTAVELINYIQFSVAKIINGKSKGLLEDEFNAVINNINPSSLQDNELISAYEILLTTLTDLKLNENQREHINKIVQEKKKNAVANCLNSFGSIFVPGGNLVSMLASVAYTGVSAALNYRRAVNEANLEGEESLFEICQNDLEYIDSLRSNLFIATAKVFANRSNCVQGLISENEMKQFAECVNKIYDNKDDAKSALLFLEAAEEDLKTFPPYWVARAAAILNTDINDGLFECLKKFKDLTAKNPIFKKNPYILEAAKINIEANNQLISDSKKIDENLLSQIKESTVLCIEDIKRNTPSVQSELDSMNFDLVQLYEMVGDFENAGKCIDYLEGRQLIAKNSRLKMQLRLMQTENIENRKKIMLIEKAFSSVQFRELESADFAGKDKIEKELDEMILLNYVYFHIVDGMKFSGIRFSKDGMTDFVSPKTIQHSLPDNKDSFSTVIEIEDFTWNDLAEHPYFFIDFVDIRAYYKASVVIPDDWEYSQLVQLPSKITSDISRLDSEEICSNFSTFGVKSGLKLGAKIGVGAAFGLIGLGVAAVASAKDIKNAWDSKGKKELTWLTINLVSIQEKGCDEIKLLGNNNKILLEDIL